MARGVGVEIGDQCVRVAVVETASKRVRLVSFHEQPVAAGDENTPAERASEAVRGAMSAAKARGRVAASLDAGEAILRELSLPFKADEQIRKTYRFELESLIHNHAIEDLVCDYFRISETEKGAAILAAAVPRKIVEARLEVLQKAGVDPAALDLDVAALFNACARTGAVDAEDAFLIVHGAARFTKIILVEKRRPRSIRTIRFTFPAGATPAPAPPPADDGDSGPIVMVDEDEARFADLDQNQRASLINILAKEISRFLLANAGTSAPTHILLAGEYEVEDAARMLEEGTRLPVRPLGILNRIEHALTGPDRDAAALRSAVAVGLALKACDEDELGLDFRRQEYSYARKYETVKTTALLTLELLIVLLAAVALHYYFVGDDRRLAYEEMLRRHEALYKDATGEDVTDGAEAFDRLQKRDRELQAQMGGADHPIDRSALELANQFWRALYKLQQEFSSTKLDGRELHYLIESMNVSRVTQPGNESVTVEVHGSIQSVAYAEALRSKLKETEPYSDKAYEIDIPTYTPTKEGLQRFVIRLVKARRR